MTWNTKEIGDDLLDLTVPALPTVISAGVYAFTLGIYLTAALTAGGRYEIYFGVDSLSDGAASILPPSSPAVVPNLRPRLYCGITYYVSAGGTLDLQVSNEDGAAARTFYLASAVVQRLA